MYGYKISLFLAFSFYVICITSCKKEPTPNKFEKYAGSWTCTQFSSSSSARGNSYIWSAYELGTDGKLYYTRSAPPDTVGGKPKETKDVLDFKYTITTSIVNDSNLLINESYTGLKNNLVYNSFNYSITFKLIEGLENYGNYDDSYKITKETITISGFSHSSFTAESWNRTMSKVK